MSVTTDKPRSSEPGRRPGLNTDTLALAGVFISMFAFLAAVVAVGLAARAIDEHQPTEEASAARPASAVPSSARVELRDFAIGPAALRLPAGGGTVTITNNGAVVHNLSVDGRASEMLAAGGSTQLELGDLEPGTYKMRCEVPGHEAAGMTGTVTVG